MRGLTIAAAVSLLLACASCQSVNREEDPEESFGGFRVLDGERGHPSRVYYTTEVRWLGKRTHVVEPVMFTEYVEIGRSNAREAGASVGYEYSSDRGIHRSGWRLLTVTVGLVPVGSDKRVTLNAGANTTREVKARVVSQARFQREADLWLRVLGNRDPSGGVPFDEFGKALATVDTTQGTTRDAP
jgi:hypothetical protein